MWYISFHGGSGGDNNVHAYDDSGKEIQQHVLAGGPSRDELRDIGFGPDGSFYVVNGSKNYNQLLRYSSHAHKDGSRDFKNVVVSPAQAGALVHPFAFAFDGPGACYVSSQDTNVVTGFDITDHTGSAMAVASFLNDTYPGNTLLAGTIVASADGQLPDVPQAAPNVPAPQGLNVSFDSSSGKVANSVRDVLVSNGTLFVADEPGNSVKLYDVATGRLTSALVNPDPTQPILSAPVHLLLVGSVLYVGSTGTGTIVTYSPGGDPTDLSTFATGISHASGFDFGSDGSFYAAERTKKRILKFPSTGGSSSSVFIDNLPDEPEFLLYVPN